jgi:hypothetical protein
MYMKKNLLWMMVAILTYGLAFTSCTNEVDNPTPVEMGAITQQYSCAEAAVGCIQAGVDIVLGPQNFVQAFDAVIEAVEKGTIPEERINQSVRRILKLKAVIN